VTSLRDELEAIPVTIVVATAYVTLAFTTGMLGDFVEFRERLRDHGWLTPALVVEQPWRLFSYAFLHGGPAHILFNLLTLIGLAPTLERSLGSVKFALLYLVSALGGALAVCLVYAPSNAVVGGSGALFGMMGGAVAMNMRSGRHALAFLEFEGPRRLLGLIALNLVLGYALPMVSNTGHVGGLIAGFAVTLLWLDPPSRSAARRRWRLAIAALFAGLTFASVMPVTRVDWLQREATRTADPARAASLWRAAVRSDPAGAFVPDEPRPRRR
jgi:membrane associated rhomboid family serine protease